MNFEDHLAPENSDIRPGDILEIFDYFLNPSQTGEPEQTQTNQPKQANSNNKPELVNFNESTKTSQKRN